MSTQHVGRRRTRAIVRRHAAVALAAVMLASCHTKAPPATVDHIISGSPKVFEAKLKSMRGKPVVVNYWATWCGPCKDETPRLIAAAKKYAGRVQFLGIDVSDDTSSAEHFAQRYGMPYKSLADTSGAIRRAESILGLPATHFYASNGTETFAVAGEIKAKILDDNIRQTLKA